MSKIKVLIFLYIFVLCCAGSASAQVGVHYHFDNFDTQHGIRIESVPTTAVLPSKEVRLTAKSMASVERVNAQPKPLIYTRPSSLAMTASKSPDGFTTGNAKVDSIIVESGARNGVDPVLLYAIMHRESAFKQRAISNKGARGLMQLMPGTAARFGVRDIFDPSQNIEGGARYMRFLLDSFGGDVALALAGYNAGEGAVLKYGRRIPPYSETQEYVRRISQRYALMRNPQTARNAPVVTPAQVNAIEAAEPPAPVYERNVFAVRLPDGRLRLVSQ